MSKSIASLPVLSRTNDHIIYGETLPFGVILHGYVRKPFTKGKLMEVREAIKRLSNSLTVPLFAFHLNPTDHWRTFVKMIGGVPDQTRVTGDGVPVEMYRFHPLD